MYSITLYTFLSVSTNDLCLTTSLAFSSWTNNGIVIFSCANIPRTWVIKFYNTYMHVHSTSFCTHARHACSGPNSSSSSILVPISSAVKRNFNFFGTWRYADPSALQSI